MKRSVLLLLGIAALARPSHSATLATFQTSVGNMQLELFDEDKPVTVSNFIKYVTSGRFADQIIQRWEPNFVIQGGGYRVATTTNGLRIESVSTFGNITNEYSVGRTFSNTYGTIAMARRGGDTNSASSQWFLNLTNNAFLDTVDGGFTVFGRVITGTNVLNRFVPPPPTNGIYQYPLSLALPTLPVLTPNPPKFSDLIYVDVLLQRDLHLTIMNHPVADRVISWSSVAGVTNTVQYSTTLLSKAWTTITNVIGSGSTMSIADDSADHNRVYRVTLEY